MASITAYNSGIWKTLTSMGDSYTIFWKDFNPTNSDMPMSEPDMTASWETSYNLGGFQAGNEVCFGYIVWEIEWLSNTTITYTMRFQEYKWGWQNAWWVDSFTDSYSGGDYYQSTYWYVWIDSDEIWTDATRYSFLFEASWWGISATHVRLEFTISNLDFDDSLHAAGYLRVQWTHLCYTDASYSSTRWYKHIINMDSSYSATNVWSDKAGSIWLPNNSSDNHIYYIDANWYTRRTKESQAWFDEGHSSAWSSNKWYIRVSNGNTNNWYAHLCYVNNGWYKRRIITWWV